MFFIVLGVIALLVSFGLQTSLKTKTVARIVRVVAIVVVVVGLFSSAIIQIGAGKVGVTTLFGKVQNHVLSSGLNIVNPLVQVVKFDTRTQNYTMASAGDEADADDAIHVLTSDGLELALDVTVLFRVQPNETPRILSTIGEDYINTIVRPIARTKIRDIAANYQAVDVYSSKRNDFQQKIFTLIEKDFADRGLVLEQLLVRNILLPVSVKESIESKIRAEQDAQKMQFVLQKEQQEAERKRIEAQGISDYQKLISQSLTANQLQYEMIKAYQAIATSDNSKIIILGDGKGGTPIIIGNQ